MWRACTSVAAVLVSLSWAIPPTVSGQDPGEETETGDSVRVVTLTPVQVEGRRDDLSGIAVSASQGYVGYRDLRPRPLSREGELLETVPGMILTQHSGDGKSRSPAGQASLFPSSRL